MYLRGIEECYYISNSEKASNLKQKNCRHERESLTVSHLLIVDRVSLTDLVESFLVTWLLEVSVTYISSLDIPVDYILSWRLL